MSMRSLSLRGVWMNPPRSCFINELLLCSHLFALTNEAVFQADELRGADPTRRSTMQTFCRGKNENVPSH